MDDITRAKYLPIALIATGLVFIFAMYPLMIWIWPAGWGLTPPQPEYEQIIIGTFGILGIFLVLAAKNPSAHLKLIWFAIWLNLVYATIMVLMVLADRTEHANLFGNVPVQYLIAGVLWYLLPRHKKRPS
ncbi:DUF6632 domain-containing protein [Microbulbifer sp. 2205BS26-8]|uniref:DUF6632 domain-containing protein n=1 Tax=Microbulbifer sp. 2205BS26-8 TaxID=3064386 RepID=UPI00273D74D0|nr:DUF6632 domain-containing protein [Microbulbifer sp. 2205BS26-8]MDP5211049.1 hypothetical protein [Microbulbifer sp. 2205BS26-8]